MEFGEGVGFWLCGAVGLALEEGEGLGRGGGVEAVEVEAGGEDGEVG